MICAEAFKIWQGTDFILHFRLPYAVTAEDTIIATVSQCGETVLEYQMGVTGAGHPAGAITIDAEDDHLIHLALAQKDTQTLAAGDAEIQVRVRRDEGTETFAPVHGVIGAAANRSEL